MARGGEGKVRGIIVTLLHRLTLHSAATTQLSSSELHPKRVVVTVEREDSITSHHAVPAQAAVLQRWGRLQ